MTIPLRGSPRAAAKVDSDVYLGQQCVILRERQVSDLIFRVGAVNISGWSSSIRQHYFEEYFRSAQCDCIIVSESNLNLTNLRRWNRNRLGRNHASDFCVYGPDGPSSDLGIAICLANRWTAYVEGVDQSQRRALRLRLRFRGGALHIIGVYFPSGTRATAADIVALSTSDATDPADPADPRGLALTRTVKTWVEDAARAHARIVVAGDMNGCMDPSLERYRIGPDRHVERPSSSLPETLLLRGLTQQGLVTDPYRRRNPNAPGVTRKRQDAVNGYISLARLDYILTDGDTARTIVVDVDPSQVGLEPLGLDHFPVYAELDATPLLLPLVEPEPDLPLPMTKRVDTRRLTPEHLTAFAGYIKDRYASCLSTRTTADVDAFATRSEAVLWRAAMAKLPIRTMGRRRKDDQDPNIIYHARRWLSKQRRRCEEEIEEGHAREDWCVRAIARFGMKFPALALPLERAGTRVTGLRGVDRLKRMDLVLHRWDEKRLANARARSIAAAVKTRFDDFATQPGVHLQRILEKNKTFTSITRVRTADGAVIDDGVEVKLYIQDFFQRQSPVTEMGSFEEFPGWADVYKPLASLDPAYLDPVLRDVTADEILDTLGRTALWKAPGSSGITAGMIKAAMPVLGQDLAGVFTIMLRNAYIPGKWLDAIMLPIPKDKDWTGSLDRVRSIMLLDVFRKLFLHIVTDRLTVELDRGHALSDWNVGFRRGLHGPDKVAMIRSARDVCAATDRTLFLTQFDVAKAFDSVSLSSLIASFKRVRMPEILIDLFRNVYTGRRARVKTGHGLTAAYRQGRGVEQGDHPSPLAWTIFYDALLIQANNSNLGVSFDAEGDGSGFTVSCLAMADDLETLATSEADNRALIGVVDEFMLLHKIRVNGAKTVMAVQMFPSDERWPAPVQLRSSPGDPITDIRAQNAKITVLGVPMRLDGSSDAAVAVMTQKAEAIAGILSRKATSYKILRSVVNTVLIPSVVYRTWGNTLSAEQLTKVERRWLRVVKHGLGLPSTTANVWIWDPNGYKINRLSDIVLRQHVTGVLRTLSSPHISHAVAVQHLRYWQRKEGWTCMPLAVEQDTRWMHGDYYKWLARLLAEWKLTLLPNRAETELDVQPTRTNVPLHAVLDHSSAKVALPSLAERLDHDVRALFNLMDPNLDLRERIPGARVMKNSKWYQRLQQDWQSTTPRHRRILLAPTTPSAKRRLQMAPELGDLRRGAPRMTKRLPTRRILTPRITGIGQRHPTRKRTRADEPEHPGRRPTQVRTGYFEPPSARPMQPDAARQEPAVPVPAPQATGIKFIICAEPPRPVVDLTLTNLRLEATKQVPSQDFWDGLERTDLATIYTDGSVKGMTRGGYAVIFVTASDPERAVILGAYDGPGLSSTRMEALAIIHALAILPIWTPVAIHSDSMNAIQAVRSLVEDRTRHGGGRRVQHTDSELWAFAHRIWSQRTAPTTLTHVRAHTGIQGNETADEWANRARESYPTAWSLDGIYAQDHRYALGVAGWDLHQPAIRTLKSLTKAWNEQELREHMERRYGPGGGEWTHGPHDVEEELEPRPSPPEANHSNRNEEDMRDNDAIQAVDPDYSLRPPWIPTDGDTKHRAFATKLLAGNLPTMERQFCWGYAYPDAQCRRCLQAVETQTHLWTCPAIAAEDRQQVQDALHQGIRQGSKVTQDLVVQLVGPFLQDGDALGTKWVTLGLLPQRLVLMLAAGMDLTETKARTCLAEALRRTRRVVYEKIWKERCRTTVHWERANSITAGSKRVRGPGRGSQEVPPHPTRPPDGVNSNTGPRDVRMARMVQGWMGRRMGGWRLCWPGGEDVCSSGRPTAP